MQVQLAAILVVLSISMGTLRAAAPAGDDAVIGAKDCVCYATPEAAHLKPWELEWHNPAAIRGRISICSCYVTLDMQKVGSAASYLMYGTRVNSPPVSSSSYDGRALGEAAGVYLSATNMMENLLPSRCSYLVEKKAIRTSDAVVQIVSRLRAREREEFLAYLNGDEWRTNQQENLEFVNGFLKSGEKDGTDSKTLCGLLVGIVLTKYDTASKNWLATIGK